MNLIHLLLPVEIPEWGKCGILAAAMHCTQHWSCAPGHPPGSPRYSATKKRVLWFHIIHFFILCLLNKQFFPLFSKEIIPQTSWEKSCWNLLFWEGSSQILSQTETWMKLQNWDDKSGCSWFTARNPVWNQIYRFSKAQEDPASQG